MQKELFELSGPVVDASKVMEKEKGWLDQFQVTFRIDHLFILAICSLVFYVLVFSFGVEKGKRFALDELKAEQAKREQISQQLKSLKPVTPPEVPEKAPKETMPKATEPEPFPSGPEPSAPAAAKDRSSGRLPGKYTIQIVTYTSESRANQEVERLRKLGYESFVISSGRFFEVCMEAFQTVKEAGQKLALLRQEGFAPNDAFIRPLKLNLPID